jgi:DNA-binding beta-propeller fold protein YncE
MKKITSMLGLSVAALLVAAPLTAQTTPPEIAFDATNFAQLPDNMYLGEGAGVAVNSKGHVFVFHRGNTNGPAYGAAAAQLLELDASGKFVREIGRNLYAWSFAHSVRVDRNDNIWIADKGSDMVVKFSPAGKVLMTFGRKAEASDEGAHPLEHPRPPLPPVNGQFRQVTDMAWDSQGNTYVSDGYINSRVAKYDPDGNFLMSFGEPGSGPGQLNTPHSIAVDAKDNVYVADRGNGRIQVFDTNGKVIRAITIDVPVPADARPVIGNPANPAGNKTQLPGSPWTLCISPGPTQYIYASDSFPGRIYKISLDGKVVGWLGGGGRTIKKFGWIHALACPSENTIFAAELLNWRVQKLTLHPK